MIPARYEASRFPGKLLQDLGGKSVIVRTYEATLHTKLFDEVYVVTDSESIQKEILDNKGKVILSKNSHETGSDRIAEAVSNLKEEVDIIVNVQGDEPFVSKAVLSKLLKVFKEKDAKKIDVASLVFPLSEVEEIINPNNVKVVMDVDNFALYFSRAPIPYPQDNDKAFYFQHIGVYAFRKKALQNFANLPMGMLEKAEKLENLRFLTNHMKVKMLVTLEKSVGIDTPADLEKARKQFKPKNNES